MPVPNTNNASTGAAINGVVPAPDTEQAKTLTAAGLLSLRQRVAGPLVLTWAQLAASATLDPLLQPAADALKGLLVAQGINFSALRTLAKANLANVHAQAASLVTTNPHLTQAEVRALVRGSELAVDAPDYAASDAAKFDALVAALPQIQQLAASLG